TGEVYLTGQKSSDISIEIINELSKFKPIEILFNDKMLSLKSVCTFIKNKLNCTTEIIDEFSNNHNFKVEDNDIAQKALSGLINYLNTTQENGARRLKNINFYKDNQYMGIDVTAKRNLELTERNGEKYATLLWVLDKTKTAMGKRYIRQAVELPLLSLPEITRRQSAVTEFVNDINLSDEINKCLSGIYDMERLMTRVIYNTVNPREVKSLGFTLQKLPNLKYLLKDCKCKYLQNINDDIHTLEEVCNLIENSIVDEPSTLLKDGNIIKQGFNSDLDELRELCNNSKKIITQVEEKEREKSGIKNLKIGYNRVFGYYIEITKSNYEMVPESYIRKQTLTNCERYITQELKDIEGKILSASDKILALESEIFNEIKKYIANFTDEIQKTAISIAKLDFILSLATVARENNYVCPTIKVDGEISIKDGRHPVVEKVLSDAMFVPNDTRIDISSNRMIIITGPNMAGKSTYMRQVAIITVMAQIGSFVPASSADISICDKIF
ncbi:MAG: DNA mismatch repair protein MutS, partial [Oscillospiraceae bacterium]